MLHNPVIDTLLQRKSIRKYTNVQPSDEVLETIVRAGQQAPFAGDPTGQSLGELEADFSDGGGVRCVGGAQDQFFAIEKVEQARVAPSELDHEVDDALQDLVQAHFPHHHAADLAEQSHLLFGTLEALLQVLGPWHDLIIPLRREASLPFAGSRR